MPKPSRPFILLADDREENRYVLGRILTEAGFSCTEASTGAQTLAIAETQPDLIILDVRLPDISGYEVCQRIKQNPRTASIPVLQISASFVSTEDRVRALDAGADGYLTHPIDRMMLVATVRALLRLRIAESSARKSAEQWETTFDALPEGLAVLDADNRLVRWNRSFTTICAPSFLPAHGEDPSAFLAQLMGVKELPQPSGITPFTTELSIGNRSVQLSIGLIAPKTVGSDKIMILFDTTDRKLAEFALRTAEKLAATGKLANAIAHEINNPLEALTNLIYLARSSENVHVIQDLLSTANTELERIGRITKQTLAFHRDSQVPVSIDLGELLSEIIAVYQRSSGTKHVHVRLQAGPAPTICGFPGQLRQVFGNLVRNAIEAAPPNSNVMVRLMAVHRRGRPGLRVTVHDCGAGIPRHIQEKIFDPFFTTKELKGSGLGLWVSKALIAKHNGMIRFRSSERAGRSGTTFEIYLPLVLSPSESPAAVST